MIRRPIYYQAFQCTASSCSDNCCIGWEIDIDKESLERYQAVQGAFGARLQENIQMGEKEEELPYFRLGKDKRCPFLNEQNLCDVILELGEEQLCQICQDHPRYYDWFSDGSMEAGIGLCCEAAAELILKQQEGETFLEEVEAPDWRPEIPSQSVRQEAELEAELMQGRKLLFACIRPSGSSSTTAELDACMNRICQCAERLQVCWDEARSAKDVDAVQCSAVQLWTEWFWTKENVETFLDRSMELEINDEKWLALLQNIRKKVAELLEKRMEFLDYYQEYLYEYEQLLQYFLFRHYMRCRYDDNLAGSACFALLAVSMIQLMDLNAWNERGILEHQEQIDLCKMLSREIEYSEENLAAWIDWCARKM